MFTNILPSRSTLPVVYFNIIILSLYSTQIQFVVCGQTNKLQLFMYSVRYVQLYTGAMLTNWRNVCVQRRGFGGRERLATLEEWKQDGGGGDSWEDRGWTSRGVHPVQPPPLQSSVTRLLNLCHLSVSVPLIYFAPFDVTASPGCWHEWPGPAVASAACS